MFTFDKLDNLKDKYQILLENLDIYTWIYNFSTKKFIYISPSVTKLRKITIEKAMKETLDDAFFSYHKKKFSKLIEARVESFLNGDKKEDIISKMYEVKQFDRTQKTIEVEVFTKIILDEDKNHIYIYGRTSDISQRKQIELQLKNETRHKKDIIKKLVIYEEQVSQILNELNEKNETLRNIANTDELTGAYNRHYFDKVIINELERNNRYYESLSLIIFDIDHFKKVNDTWGHSTGDEVLIKVSQSIRENIRKPDVFIRWGGEEFTILLPQTNLEGAIVVANKLRVLLENLEHPHVGRVTASFAVAERINGETFENWFQRLDSALYKAKDSGRNCVTAAERQISEIFWKKDWESGNRIIDRQHKYLLSLSNKLLKSALVTVDIKETQILIYKFIKHIKYHLKYEEQLLKELNYTKILDHTESHNKLIKRIDSLVLRYENNEIKIFDFLNFLLDDSGLNQVIKEDIKYLKILKQ